MRKERPRMQRMVISLAVLAGLLAGAAVMVAAVQLWPGGGGGTPDTAPQAAATSPEASPAPASSGQIALASGCLSAADIYAQVRPSVVEITSTSGGRTPFGPQAQGTGSGIVIDNQGSILTNEHVVA